MFVQRFRSCNVFLYSALSFGLSGNLGDAIRGYSLYKVSKIGYYETSSSNGVFILYYNYERGIKRVFQEFSTTHNGMAGIH